MPLFARELNELADYIGRSDLTIWLHTAAPTNDDPDNGRTTVGGGAYESGATLTAANISDAADGDITNKVAIDFGTADEAVGTVVAWSAFRGSDAVAFGTIPSVAIPSGATFQINAQTLDINGSTS